MLRLADVRLAARDLARRPVFTATVVLTLAVSLGATTAAFAFIDAVFFTRLPVGDQNRLVVMGAMDPSRSWFGRPWPVPWETRTRLVDRRGAFDDVAAVVSWGAYPFAARDGDHIVHLRRSQVSGNFFNVLGARPVLGRLLRPDDDIMGAPATVVLSERLWRRDYGADPAILGRLLFFAGGNHRVVGVAPAELSYPDESDAWCPVTPERLRLTRQGPDSTPFLLLGRMRSGVALNAARGELEAVLRATPTVNAIYGSSTAAFAMPTHGSVTPFVDVVLGGTLRPALMVLFGAVILVLVIACTNVAGLLLARGIARAPEIAIRFALGATRRRIVGYLLTESAILGALGGALGLALAVTLIRAGLAAAPQDLPMIGTAHINVVALAFVTTITLLSVVAFGLAPAMRDTRQAPSDALRGGRRSATAAPLALVGRRALVSAQVALALVVLSGAALLSRTLAELEATPLGFDPTHLLFFRQDFMVPAGSFPDSEYTRRFESSVYRLAERLPVTTSLSLPFTGAGPSAPYAVDGQPMAPAGRGPTVRFEYALDDYFAVMGIPVVGGRPFTRRDDAHATPVLIVNRAFAQQVWPGQDALGHRVHFATDTAADRWWTVVGLVGDTRYDDPAMAPPPTVYINPRQPGFGDPWLVLRTSGDPSRAAEPLERTIAALDPILGLSRTTTGPALLRTRLARPRALTALLSALSVTALALAAIGLFGVLSAFVRERRSEIAVRSALGATPAQLRSLVVGQAVSLSALGVAVGVPLAFGGARVLQSFVSDVRPADVLTVVLIAVVLIVVVAAATLGPTVRASRVDPRTALSAD